MTIEENIPLAPFTTFKIGGPARYFARVQDIQEMRDALSFAKKKEHQVLILGGGSNVLIDDNGLNGLVIKIELTGIEIQKEGENTVLIAAAGERWDGLVAKAVEENLWGLENLSGISGTVGGAVAGNIGAYGQALSQTLVWAEVLDMQSGSVIRLSNPDCRFGYRDSFFKHEGSHYAVLRAAFKLSSAFNPDLSYKDMAERFNNQTPTLAEVRLAVLTIRHGKFPDLGREGTAGSFFKNPIMSEVEAQKLSERFTGMPLFALPESTGVKIPLAWLLDKVLHLRGLKVGGARLFEKQALVIVAEKNALASDVATLAAEVHKQVKEKIGIEIEKEVKIL